VFAPKAWGQFYQWLRSKDEAGVLAFASTRLWFGSLIVAFHPVWTGLPLVLTLFGWAQVVKAVVYFSVPRIGLKPLEWLSSGGRVRFAGGGVVLLALSAALAFHLFAAA
jgi:hypothetical protein